MMLLLMLRNYSSHVPLLDILGHYAAAVNCRCVRLLGRGSPFPQLEAKKDDAAKEGQAHGDANTQANRESMRVVAADILVVTIAVVLRLGRTVARSRGRGGGRSRSRRRRCCRLRRPKNGGGYGNRLQVWLLTTVGVRSATVLDRTRSVGEVTVPYEPVAIFGWTYPMEMLAK